MFAVFASSLISCVSEDIIIVNYVTTVSDGWIEIWWCLWWHPHQSDGHVSVDIDKRVPTPLLIDSDATAVIAAAALTG